MATQQGQAFEDLRNTISECSRVVRNRWRLAVIGISMVGTVAFWYSQYLPREYTATTMFERRDDVVLQNLVQSRSPYGFDHLKTTMKLDMTGSRALAAAAVTVGLLPPEHFESDGPLTDAEQRALGSALGKYKLRTSVRLLHSTSSLDTIELRCNANDPEIAREFVVALRDNYIRSVRERIHEILTGTKEFFEAEVARLREKVDTATVDLQEGFADYPGLDPTDVVSVGNRLEAIRAQYNAAYQRKAEIDAEIAAREEFLRSAPAKYVPGDTVAPEAPQPVASGRTTPLADPVIERAIQGVRERIVELTTGRRMTADHPEVRAAMTQLKTLKSLRVTVAELAPQPPSEEEPVLANANPAMSEAQRDWQNQKARINLELDVLRRQQTVAQSQLNESQQRLDRFGTLYERLLAQGDELRRLQRVQKEGSGELALYQGHLNELERIMAAETGERGTQFALLEEPRNVSRPIKPRVASIFVVCSGLGLAAAALLVALAELFDRSFRSSGQVTRALGIPVLEGIGVIPTPREQRRAVVSRFIWGPTLTILLIALLTSATLAYAAIEMPRLHERAIERVDRILGSAGVDMLTAGTLFDVRCPR